MNTISIEGNLRTDQGTKFARAARREGQVPCVIYGGEKNIHFSATPKAFKKLIYTPSFNIAEVNVDGKAIKCFIKDTQFHPVNDELMHVDFQELVPGRKVKLSVPVKFEGDSPGVKTGGKLMQKLRYISIKTTPEHIVDEITMDISELELGFSVRVRDIVPIDGVEIMNSPGIPVASVEIPRALKSIEDEEAELAAAEAEAAEGAEGAAEGAEGAAKEGDAPAK